MTPDTSVYTDLSGFRSLRAQAQKDPNAALDQVASQFESIFTQMMVKSMRDASEPLESDWAGSSQMKSYQQMFDQQLSLDLSKRGGLGLAEIIAAQLGGASGSEREADTKQTTGDGISDLGQYRSSASPAMPPVTHLVSAEEGLETDVSAIKGSSFDDALLKAQASDQSLPDSMPGSSVAESAPAEDSNWLPETPTEFISSLWGLAKAAGQALGKNPKVILAQAALETGWGKFTIQNADGSNSFNLFGIKGGKQWSGSEASVSTLEYVDGIAERQIASFRSYDSLADAFTDYVNFLSQSPRYEKALEAGDDQGFLNGLQEGGYATDPNYAEKIIGILNRSEFQEVESELKNSKEVSI